MKFIFLQTNNNGVIFCNEHSFVVLVSNSVQRSLYSDSSSNTPGSEADDEGEESSLESSTAIQPVIPWWDDEQPTEVDMSAMDGDKNEVAIEQSLDLMRDRSGKKIAHLFIAMCMELHVMSCSGQSCATRLFETNNGL